MKKLPAAIQLERRLAVEKLLRVRKEASSEHMLFISHTSSEAPLAIELKNAIEEAFQGKLKAFVSSDYRDLKAGDVWLREIDGALKKAVALVVICSLRSITRPWIHFESGCAWIRNVPIIPVCHGGLAKSSLDQPLSVFQALDLAGAGFTKKLLHAVGHHVKGLKIKEPDYDECDKRLNELSALIPTPDPAPAADVSVVSIEPSELSDEAKKLLFEMSEDPDGAAFRHDGREGYSITIGSADFVREAKSPRTRAMWDRAFRELVRGGLIKEGPADHFEVTDEGFNAIEDCGLIPK